MEISVGVTVFQRTAKLKRLLESSRDAPISEILVADNGIITDEKNRLYNKNYPFRLEVLDLKFDSGLAYSRNKLVETVESDFLLIIDSDMTVPKNVTVLKQMLLEKTDFGGISGILFENGVYRSGCWDLFEEGLVGQSDVIMLDIREEKRSELIKDHHLFQFESIPNATLFRTTCLKEQSWDPKLKLEEHLDFYIAHNEKTEWKFGACPEVVFNHYPGGSEEYEQLRYDRRRDFRKRSLRKWGYRKRIYARSSDWIQTINFTNKLKMTKHYLWNVLPPEAIILYHDSKYGRTC